MFAFVPYRFDHFHHLELQATIFLPLTLLYFERDIRYPDRGATPGCWRRRLSRRCIPASTTRSSWRRRSSRSRPVRLWRMPADVRARVIRATIPAAIVAADRRRAVRLRVRAQSRDARRAPRSRRSALFGDAGELPGDDRRQRDSRRMERAVRTSRSASCFPACWRWSLAAVGLYAIDRRRATLLAIGGDRLRHLARV